MINHDEATVRPLTLAWVSRHLEVGERIVRIEALHGGISPAEMRRLTIRTRDGHTRDLVLRTYVHPFSEDLLNREIGALTLLTDTGVPAPALVAVDMAAVPLLAEQLVAIHAVLPAEQPPKYVALTTAETVVVPKSADAVAWAAAIDVIRKPAPPYEGRFLHRDFQPGNVLFDVPPLNPRVPGSRASSTGPGLPGARPTSMWRIAPSI